MDDGGECGRWKIHTLQVPPISWAPMGRQMEESDEVAGWEGGEQEMEGERVLRQNSASWSILSTKH